MREKLNPQISLLEFYGEHETGQQLKNISKRLDSIPEILDIASHALFHSETNHTGRKGLTVDTIVRAALLKQMMGLTYNELSFYLQDSLSYSSFARVDASTCYSSSGLQSCISKIDASSWEAINRLLLNDAAAKGIEKGRMVRIDSTVTETHISSPSDSNLLWDCVRVMVRLLRKIMSSLSTKEVTFCDRTRAAKRRMKAIVYSRGRNRVKLYKQLINYTKETREYLYTVLYSHHLADNFQLTPLKGEAENLLVLTDKVISQTERRVFNGESVPHHEKVLSIFEPHTDIIVKGAREVQYGHKLNLTTGKSGLVLDIYIEEGNPADAVKLSPMLERQKQIYGRAPRQAAADGGYASQDNLAKAKEMGVKDIAFHKKRGLKVEDMVKSNWVYKKLYKFRAGVEGNISCLKRRFGLSRCHWKGLEKFKAYVWASSVAYNLLQLARIETVN